VSMQQGRLLPGDIIPELIQEAGTHAIRTYARLREKWSRMRVLTGPADDVGGSNIDDMDLPSLRREVRQAQGSIDDFNPLADSKQLELDELLQTMGELEEREQCGEDVEMLKMTLQTDISTAEVLLSSLRSSVASATSRLQKARAAIYTLQHNQEVRVYNAVAIPAGCNYKGGVLSGSKMRVLFTQMGDLSRLENEPRLRFNLGHKLGSPILEAQLDEHLGTSWGHAGGFVPGSAFWRAHGLAREWMYHHDEAKPFMDAFQAETTTWQRTQSTCRGAGTPLPDRHQLPDMPRIFLLNIAHSGEDPNAFHIDAVTARAARLLVRVEERLAHGNKTLGPDVTKQLKRKRKKLREAIRSAGELGGHVDGRGGQYKGRQEMAKVNLMGKLEDLEALVDAGGTNKTAGAEARPVARVFGASQSTKTADERDFTPRLRLREDLAKSELLELEDLSVGESTMDPRSACFIDNELKHSEPLFAGDDQADDEQAVNRGLTEFHVRRHVFEAVRHFLVKATLDATGQGDNWEPPPASAFASQEALAAHDRATSKWESGSMGKPIDARLDFDEEAHWWRRFKAWELRAASAFDLEIFGDTPSLEDFDRVYADHTERRRAALASTMSNDDRGMDSSSDSGQESDEQIDGGSMPTSSAGGVGSKPHVEQSETEDVQITV